MVNCYGNASCLRRLAVIGAFSFYARLRVIIDPGILVSGFRQGKMYKRRVRIEWRMELSKPGLSFWTEVPLSKTILAS